jgi:DNA-binding NarL/FixJ family response regulator
MIPSSRRSDARRVLIVDDHVLLAQSLALALRGEGAVAEVADVTTTRGIVAAAELLQPDVVVLDLDLGSDRGELLIAPLARLGAAVLVLTGSRDTARLGECLAAGATAVLGKSAPLEALVAAILDPAELGSLTSPAARASLLAEMQAQRAVERERQERFGQLSPREREVLHGLLEGKSAESLAAEFVVSQATVRTQITSVLRKLGVNSQLAAVAAARRAAWSLERVH